MYPNIKSAFVTTSNIFWKFQEELAKINNFTKKKIRIEGPRYEYEVSNGYKSTTLKIPSLSM